MLTCASNQRLLCGKYASEKMTNEIVKWSLVCMRNCFKKDSHSHSHQAPIIHMIQTHGTITTESSISPQSSEEELRRCGSLSCSKVEQQKKEYSKCSRCRRVSYCCKECQRGAWALHKNWCLKYDDSAVTSV